MPRAWLHIKVRPSREGGFSVVEAILAATVFGFFVTGLVGAVVYGRSATANAGDHARAELIAEEGIDATRSIASSSYANIVTDGTYGLSNTGGQWAFSGTSDTSDIYTRQVTIATGGSNRKDITCTVSWTLPSGGTSSVTLTTRMTNWAANIKSWSNAIVAGGQDVTGTNDAIKTFALGNYAYTVLNVATTNNFVITNISNPASPTQVSLNSVAGTPTNIFVSGNYAYITNSTASSGLKIYDISTPSTPSLVKTVSLTGTGAARGVYVSGNYAYVVRSADATAGANELTVVNVTTPSSASVVGGYNNDNNMNEVWVSGSYAFISQNASSSTTVPELQVVNISTPTSPVAAGSYNPAGKNNALTVGGSGNTVFIGYSTTLDSVNVTTPTAPAHLSNFTAGGTIQDVDTDGGTGTYAFLGTSNTAGEFQVVNISNPSAMTSVKIVDVSGTASTVGGVSYDSALDEVAGASASNTQEVVVFTKN